MHILCSNTFKLSHQRAVSKINCKLDQSVGLTLIGFHEALLVAMYELCNAKTVVNAQIII